MRTGLISRGAVHYEQEDGIPQVEEIDFDLKVSGPQALCEELGVRGDDSTSHT